MPVRKKAVAPPKKKAISKAELLAARKDATVSQKQLNRIFAEGREALARPHASRTKADKARIERFSQFAPKGTARKLGSKALAKKRKTYR